MKNINIKYLINLGQHFVNVKDKIIYSIRFLTKLFRKIIKIEITQVLT